jgi:hypothetical protein
MAPNPSTDRTDNIKKSKPKPSRPNSSWLQFTGMAVQMAAIILAGVYFGKKSDEWLQWKFPVGTLVFTVGSVCLSMYYIIKQVLKN